MPTLEEITVEYRRSMRKLFRKGLRVSHLPSLRKEYRKKPYPTPITLLRLEEKLVLKQDVIKEWFRIYWKKRQALIARIVERALDRIRNQAS